MARAWKGLVLILKLMNKLQIIKTCRRLRRDQTKAEKELWELVRNRKINGLKFLRQHPFIYQDSDSMLYYYIVDFYCAEKRLIIELEIHKAVEFIRTL